jgi:tetratricopeptide (TPR) repeat protein
LLQHKANARRTDSHNVIINHHERKQPVAFRSYRPFSQNAETRSNLGVALYFNHQLMHALAVFKKAMALDPSLLAPHLFSGLAFYRLSNPDAAVPELEKAVTLTPSNAIARTWLGYAYVSQSRYEQAVNEFQVASQLDPGNVDIWYALGSLIFKSVRMRRFSC